MQRVLVTGANGFVGSRVVASLADAGYRVTATVRSPLGTMPTGDVEVAVCREFEDYAPLLRRADALVHCGGVAHRAGAPAAEFKWGNVDWTHALASFVAGSESCRTMVHLSSIAARKHDGEGAPAAGTVARDLYGGSKKRAEAAVLALGDRGKLGVNLRPPLIYGEGAPGNWARLLLWAGRPVPLPFAKVRARRHYLDVAALVGAVEAVLASQENRGGTLTGATGCYEIADRDAVALPEIISALRSAFGLRPMLFPGPIALMDRMLRGLGREGIADGLFQPLPVDWRPFSERFAWTPEEETLEAMQGTVRAQA